MTTRTDEKGQGLVEMALILPVFILLIMGIFDLGRGILAANTAAEAARQGARYAVTFPSDTAGIQNAATTAAYGLTLSASTPISISEPSGACIGNPVTVTVTGTFVPVTPLISTFTGSSGITIVRRTTMLIQSPGTGC